MGFSRAVASIATAPDDNAIVRDARPIDDRRLRPTSRPGAPAIDLPLDTNRCKSNSQTAAFILGSSGEGTPSTRRARRGHVLPPRDRLRRGRQRGRCSLDRQAFEVWHPVLGSPTATLNIGTARIGDARRPPRTPTPARAESSARRPRSLPHAAPVGVLAEKPVRISKGVPVLRANKRYRFTGRLTCVINGTPRVGAEARADRPAQHGRQEDGRPSRARRSPPRAPSRSSWRTRGLATLTFRFRNSDGQRSQVSIKIKVEKKKKSQALGADAREEW